MKGIITFVLFYYIKTIVAQGDDPCQQFPFPDNIYFNETSAAGSIIFVSNETDSTKQDWTMSTNTRVELMFVNQTYQITLLTAVDLDVTNPSDNCVSGLEIKPTMTCIRAGGLDPVTKVVTFHVLPVNEYAPDVDAVPGIMISEGNVPLPYYLAALLAYFKDRDCPKEHLVLSITKYSSDERDVSQYFMVNSSTGYLYQIKRFDYENTTIQCGMGKGGGFLNVTAEDGPHTTSKPLEVMFVDVDDTPPVFVKSECSSTCYSCPVSAINANVEYAYQGTMVTDPPSIKALDPDTDPTNITYSMDVYPEKFKDNIQFDNGTFVLLQSFANFSGYAEESDFTVTVTMQAFENNGNGTRESETLHVTINVKVKDGRSPATSDFPVIAVAVTCAGVLVIILVVVLVFFLKRSKPQNNKKYRVSTKRKENETDDDVTNTEKMEKNAVIDPVDTAPEKRFVDETKENSDYLEKGTENPLYSEINKDKEATVDLESD